ncbi:MAG: YjfB family protein [Oscillospiraceae bacterium]|nr:YjfB family protein [Oscillospiraceae bacterium]
MMMNIASAGAIPAGTSIANVAHGLSITVMKKGMEAQEELAMQLIQKMMPSTPGKGQYIDIYV